MASFFDQAIQEYHEQFATLPSEYYDSGCRDWQEEFYHQPKPLSPRAVSDKDIADFNQSFNFCLSDFHKQWHSDTTPSRNRNRLFYARRLASLFSSLARMAERPCVPQKEYDALSETALRYQELSAILEGKKPWQFYSEKVWPPCVGSLPSDGNDPEWKTLKTWDSKPATSITWQYWQPQKEAHHALKG